MIQKTNQGSLCISRSWYMMEFSPVGEGANIQRYPEMTTSTRANLTKEACGHGLLLPVLRASPVKPVVGRPVSGFPSAPRSAPCVRRSHSRSFQLTKVRRSESADCKVKGLRINVRKL